MNRYLVYYTLKKALRKSPKFHITDRITNDKLAILISALSLSASLLIGINQCQTNNYIVNEAETKKKLILYGTIDKNFIAKLYPFNSDYFLLKAEIIYPDAVNKEPWPVSRPNNDFAILVLNDALCKILKENIQVDENNYTIVSDGICPVVINSNYVVDSTVYNIKSLYYIEYTAVLTKINKFFTDCSIDFSAITFVSNIKDSNNPKDIVNNIYNSLLKPF